jgi:hypothetical protein
MSKRTLRDYIYQGFFARDKASVAAIADAAEEDPPADGEPDGDEGKHASNVHVHIEHKSGENGTGDADGDKDEERFKKIEDTVKALDAKITKVLDAVTKARTGDAEGDDDDKGDDKGDDDDKKGDETTDAEGETGAQTASAPPSAEPDLMEADPALKTGKSQMGDAAFGARVNQAMLALVRDTKARAEVLAPGIGIGVLDGAPGEQNRMTVAGTRICSLRRNALTKAAASEKGKQAMGRYTADHVKAMSCDAVRMLFLDASDRMREINNATNVPSPNFGTAGQPGPGAYRAAQAQRLAGINKANKDFWAKQNGRA